MLTAFSCLSCRNHSIDIADQATMLTASVTGYAMRKPMYTTKSNALLFMIVTSLGILRLSRGGSNLTFHDLFMHMMTDSRLKED